jgi:LPS export ABC transporter protein LptC
MKRVIIFLLTIIVGGIALGNIQLPVSSWSLFGSVSSSPTPALPDVNAQHIQVIAQTDTAASWKVTAREAALYNVGQITVLHGVFIQYLQYANPLLQMTAAWGQIDNATGDITVEGSVSMEYDNIYTIETDKISWRALDQVLHTDHPVRLFNSSIQISGYQLKSELEQYRFALQGGVRASFQFR